MSGSALLTGKRVVVTGGTGSLGQVLARRLLEGELGVPESVVIFSRSEALQHAMRLSFQHRRVATDDIVYDEERHQRLHFRIGDIRDYAAVCALLKDADVVFHAAASTTRARRS
jgi:FlaA1/EpsC-like NDP-sugar epimerase